MLERQFILTPEDKAAIDRAVAAMPPMTQDALERIAAAWAEADLRQARQAACTFPHVRDVPDPDAMAGIG